MTNRTNKSSFAGVVMAMLVVLAAGPAYADDDDDHDDLRKVKMKFAGSLLLNVEQQPVGMDGQPNAATALIGISHTKAVGNLGRADIMVVTNTGPPESLKACPAGFDKVADITSNSIVFTFNDLSLLYGDGQGVVCFNPITFAQSASVDGNWLGGSKRFANAAGKFSIVIDKIMPVNPNTQFSAESGRITGFLKRDH